MNKAEVKKFKEEQKKNNIPDISPGDIVRVQQKTQEEEREKVETFEGQVIARKSNKELGATITVRSKVLGVGVERIFPIHSPKFNIEVLEKKKARRSKLHYLRKAKGKKAKLKDKE